MNLNLEAIFPGETFHALLLMQKIPRSRQRKNMEIESRNVSFHLVRVYLPNLEQVLGTSFFNLQKQDTTWTLQAL